MCVNGYVCGVVGNDVCGLWESRRLFHRAVNICFPSAERPFSTFFVFRGRGPPKPKIRQWVLTGCACYNNPSLVFPSTNTTLPTGKNGKLSIFIDSVLHWPLRYQIILHHLVEIHFIFY